MIDAFNISDRSTWAWSDTVREAGYAPVGNGGYGLHLESADLFVQISKGQPYTQSCPTGLVFDPRATPAPVCVWPKDDTTRTPTSGASTTATSKTNAEPVRQPFKVHRKAILYAIPD